MGASTSAGSKESKRRWRRENLKQCRAITKKWKAENPGAIAKYNIAYKSATTMQMPKWANAEAIDKIYKTAQIYGLTVDHIIPLRGKTVCGLHVENNLQLLPHATNCAKGNKF